MFHSKKVDAIREKYIQFVKKYYWLTLSIYALIISFFAYHALNIGLKSDFLDLLPEKNQNVQNLRKVIEYYGGEGYLIGVIEWNTPYKNTLDFIKQLKSETNGILDDLRLSLKEDDVDWFSKKDGEARVSKLMDTYDQTRNKIKDELKIHPEEIYLQKFTLELENIFQDTQNKWQDFQKKQKDKDSGYSFLYALEDNIYAFDQYKKTIVEKKGGKTQLISAAEELSKQLEKEKEIVKYIEFKFRTGFIKDHLLFFLGVDDLKEIKEKIQKKIDYERRKKVLSSALFVDEPVSLDFKDIEKRNENSTKILKISKKTDFLEKSEDLYEYYLNDPEDMLLLLVKPAKDSSDLGFAQKLVSKSKEIGQKITSSGKYSKELSIGFTGRYVKKVEDQEIINNDLSFVSVLAVVLILIFVFFTFRNIRSLCIIGVTLVSGLIWSVGLVEMTVGYFNIVSGFLIAILSGLGVDFEVNLFNRYTEERGRGRDVYEAISIVLKTTFLSNLTTTITIAAAFYVLMLSDFKGFSQFGFTAGSGMILLLFDVILAFPAIIIISEKIRPLKLKKTQEKIQNIDNLRNKRMPYYRVIILIAIGLTIFSLYNVKNIQFNSSFYDLAAENTIGRNLEKKAENFVNMSLWPFVLYAKDWDTMKGVTKHINDLKDKNQLPTLSKVDSLYNYIPENQEEKKAIMMEIKDTLKDSILSKLKDPDEKKRVKRLKEIVDASYIKDVGEIPYELTRQFIGSVEGYFIFYYPDYHRSMSRVSSLREMSNDIQKVYNTLPASIDKSKVLISSDASVFVDIIDLMIRQAPMIFSLLILAIIFFLWLDSRSFKYILITLLPLGIGFTWIFGVTYILGWSFNYFNVMMFPIIMGISINYGVHIVHRLKEEGRAHTLFVFKTTGISVYMGALTDLVGFGTLIFALYKGLASMGQLALAGILCCASAGSFLMVALIEFREDQKRFGWKKAIFGKIDK